MLKSRKLATKLMINHSSSIILYEEKMYVYMYLPVTPQYYNFFEGNLWSFVDLGRRGVEEIVSKLFSVL